MRKKSSYSYRERERGSHISRSYIFEKYCSVWNNYGVTISRPSPFNILMSNLWKTRFYRKKLLCLLLGLPCIINLFKKTYSEEIYSMGVKFWITLLSVVHGLTFRYVAPTSTSQAYALYLKAFVNFLFDWFDF